MSYSGTQVYFPPSTSFDAIGTALTTRFPLATRTASGSQVVLSFGGVKVVRVAHEAYDYVAEEAQWLGTNAAPDIRDALARATHRVVITPDDPAADPDDLYNELLSVFEALYAMPDAVGADPFDGSLHRAPAKDAVSTKQRAAKKSAKPAAKKPAAKK
ncbi:hypothetical protein OV203_11300 [Nannocystis sp. ILAH1]|uniref:hypothetical protein n=1 Tax=unclassified Nannocystis TaxID=2627009 RepID=UPI00226D54EB|nr:MULTISPECIES: hypothetical protein [unclassified Nannocystis]MCY0987714.1 hypothetical protein [Nannocystis sp. ILAH1]MCY1070486.1 hypothetical protein [Nannocystis sp. RBIL2]